jgi:hypothetical protein
MHVSRIAFIVPYFGKFNNYFKVWLHSCKYNTGIDWLIFTDDRTPYNYPENVKVQYTTFEDTKKLIQSKFDFPIILTTPYQLCEFKLTYGEAYEKYLSEYDFWGFCDIDIIWGNIRRHITEEILERHSKISWRGHLTLFKNNKRINALYRSKVDGIEFYKYALSNDTGFPLAADERVINSIFDDAGEKIYKELIFADLKIRSFNFNILHFAGSEDFKNKHQVFYWENGELFRLYVHENKVYKENFAYVHFLKRPMAVLGEFDIKRNILIAPNYFMNTDEAPDRETILKLSKQQIYWSYIFSKISFKYLKIKSAYYKSKRVFLKKYSFLPHHPTHVELPNTISESLKY